MGGGKQQAQCKHIFVRRFLSKKKLKLKKKPKPSKMFYTYCTKRDSGTWKSKPMDLHQTIWKERALAILLGVLVENTRVNGRGKEVVGGLDGVDVAGAVEVEILHRDYL